MQTIEQKLERLRNRRTLYELIVQRGDCKLLVGYTQKTRDSLFKQARRVGESLVKITRSENITLAKKVGDGAVMGEWTLCWTGRTERDAIIGGEYPFVRESDGKETRECPTSK
jgi:hypothetical protein